MLSEATSGLSLSVGCSRSSIDMVGAPPVVKLITTSHSAFILRANWRKSSGSCVGRRSFGSRACRCTIAAPARAASIAAFAISSGVIGRWGDMVGVWIEPVTAHVMMTLPCAAAIVECLAERNQERTHEAGNSRRIARAMNIQIRRAEPADYKALCELHGLPNVLRGTLQLPFPSEENWKSRLSKLAD